MAGKRIAFNPAIGRAALTQALAAYPWIALVLDLRLGGLDADGPTLSLASIHYRCLKKQRFRVRALPALPGSNDVLVLAGPTMSLGGPCYIYRWCRMLCVEGSADSGGVTLEAIEPLLMIRNSCPGLPK